MAIVECKECGKEVSTEAQSCPNCGAVLKKKTSRITYFAAALLLLIVLGAVVFFINDNLSTPSSKPEAGFKMPSIGEQIITFDEYQRVQDGMSYSKVVGIIGARGEEISRSKMDGVPGVMESLETVMYQWVNSNGSNMNAMFQNDKLVQKAQFGLK